MGCAEANVDPACLKCGIRGCMKCPNLILVDDRRCVDDCPTGYTEIWSSAPDYMGRICYPVGLSGSFLTALVGVTLGAILCFTMLLVAASLIRKKHRRRLIRNVLIDDKITRHDFLRQLSELRPQSEYFLQMLNDTRRQIRKLHLSGDSEAASIYNPVIRDLAKILILLNKPVELLHEPPHDWNRLYSWAERALDCYKPQIEQLIEFLQTSTTPYDARLVSSQHSTFKSQQSATSTNTSNNSQTQQLLGSLISLHELEEQLAAEENKISPPQSAASQSNTFGDAFDHVKDYLSSSPGVRSSTIWLEDEFFRLGLRPQDEITTELLRKK
uniref:CSON005140 protein n=1 Tax=Culicoides sonorensis TaxID=179676 RepID=A0A336LYA7_CULSO